MCPTLLDPMDYSTPDLPVPHHLLEFAEVHVHCFGDAIQPSLFSFCPQSFPASGSFPMSRLFTLGSQSIGASASASVLLMNKGLITFKIDWFYLTAVQGTLKSLLQHHSLKASVLCHSAFFMVQLSQLCMTTGKTIALSIPTFVGRVISLLFNILSRYVIDFLPRSIYLLISWLQSPSAVILEPKKRKSVTTSTFPPFICHEVMGLDTIILVFLVF